MEYPPGGPNVHQLTCVPVPRSGLARRFPGGSTKLRANEAASVGRTEQPAGQRGVRSNCGFGRRHAAGLSLPGKGSQAPNAEPAFIATNVEVPAEEMRYVVEASQATFAQEDPRARNGMSACGSTAKVTSGAAAVD